MWCRRLVEVSGSHEDDLRRSCFKKAGWKKRPKTSRCFILSASMRSNQCRHYGNFTTFCPFGVNLRRSDIRDSRQPPGSLTISRPKNEQRAAIAHVLRNYRPSPEFVIWYLSTSIHNEMYHTWAETRAYAGGIIQASLAFASAMPREEKEKKKGRGTAWRCMLSPHLLVSRQAGLKAWEPFGSRDWMRVGKR